jgi:NAD(P)-dependent dehydrogenase (short-subunit alcohol dehydrogenase family)
MPALNTSMQGKVCMVTGANSGIGKVTAMGLAGMGATVVMVCRDRTRGEEARQEIKHHSGNEAVDLLLADFSSQQAIRQLAQEFQQRYTQLHVLVNNVGSIFPERQESIDGIEMTFTVNHLASFLLTNLLLETLKASAPARIVNVASASQTRSINLDDLESEKKYRPLQAYGQSKLATVLFTYALAERLAGTGVTVNCLHPGAVATNNIDRGFPPFARPLAGIIKRFLITPEQGAQTSLYLATSPEVEGVTGKYFVRCQQKPSVLISYDPSLQERLWKVSAAMTHLASSPETNVSSHHLSLHQE